MYVVMYVHIYSIHKHTIIHINIFTYFLLIIYCFNFERVAKCVQLFMGPWPSATHTHINTNSVLRCKCDAVYT